MRLLAKRSPPASLDSLRELCQLLKLSIDAWSIKAMLEIRQLLRAVDARKSDIYLKPFGKKKAAKTAVREGNASRTAVTELQ